MAKIQKPQVSVQTQIIVKMAEQMAIIRKCKVDSYPRENAKGQLQALYETLEMIVGTDDADNAIVMAKTIAVKSEPNKKVKKK